MRWLIIIGLFLSYLKLQAQPYFSKVYDLDNPYHADKIDKSFILNDTLYLVGGAICNSTSTASGLTSCADLVKLDLEGNIIKQRLYDWLRQETKTLFHDGEYILIFL